MSVGRAFCVFEKGFCGEVLGPETVPRRGRRGGPPAGRMSQRTPGAPHRGRRVKRARALATLRSLGALLSKSLPHTCGWLLLITAVLCKKTRTTRQLHGQLQGSQPFSSRSSRSGRRSPPAGAGMVMIMLFIVLCQKQKKLGFNKSCPRGCVLRRQSKCLRPIIEARRDRLS